MADPPKFNFNPSATSSATSSSLFGAAAPTTGGSFGSSTPASSASTFGAKPAGTTGSLFGNATNSSTPASGTGTFGFGVGAVGQEKPAPLFGSGTTGSAWSFGPQASENTAPASSAPQSSGFQTFAAPSSSSSMIFGTGVSTSGSGAIPSGQESGGMFGNGPNPPSLGPFGSNPATTSAATLGATTPASQKPSFNFGKSTTPVGTPASTAPAAGVFGAAAGQSNTKEGNLFGPSTTPAAPTPPSSSNTFSFIPQPSGATGGGLAPASGTSNLFSNLNKTSTSATTAQSTTPSTAALTFPQPQSSSPFTLGGQQAPVTSKPSMFGNLGASSAASSSVPNQALTSQSLQSSVLPTSSAPSTTGPFGNVPSSVGLFAPQSASSAPASSGSSAFSGLGSTSGGAGGLFKTPAASKSTAQVTTSLPALGQSAATTGSIPAASGNVSTPASAAPSSTTTPSGGLLGNLGGSTAPAAPSAASVQTTGAPNAGSSVNVLGASTTGALPDAKSRLKNKSMDEILTRWATDLSKHQKDFQRQAKQVQAWDALLLKNTDQISKLYNKAFQAEKDAAEVERQLAAVEADQNELDQWLTRCESEVENVTKNIGMDAQSAGVDTERYRTYKMSEKLTDRLDDLNKDLTEVIEEVNRVSATLHKSSGPDDQLSQIVRVLNSHLQQLQMIDIGASQLQAKVDAAKKETRGLRSSASGANGWHGIGSDPTEDFYKSFRGSRR